MDLLDQEHRDARGSSIKEHSAYDKHQPENLDLGNDGVALDSLEMLTAAGVVNEFFHLHESGVEDYLLRRRRVGEWAEIVQHGLAAGTTGITFKSGGSGGKPKLIRTAWHDLLQEQTFLADLLRCRRRVVSTVPSHHIYGFLFTVLLPESLELPVESVPWNELGSLSDSLEIGDLLIAHPAIWRYLQRSLLRRPPAIWGVSSTAPLSNELHQQLYDGGLERVVEVYGSSETGGVGFREHPGEPFSLFPYYRRGEGEHLLERRSPVDDRWKPVELMDELAWQDRRRFYPRGRRDRVVQVGGENVNLDSVERALCDIPGIREAAVRLNGASSEARLKAFLVADSSEGHDRDWVAQECARRLRPVERPLSFTFGDKLPRSPLGKLVDWPV